MCLNIMWSEPLRDSHLFLLLSALSNIMCNHIIPSTWNLFRCKNYKLCSRAPRKISQRTKLGQKWAKWPLCFVKIACFARPGVSEIIGRGKMKMVTHSGYPLHNWKQPTLQKIWLFCSRDMFQQDHQWWRYHRRLLDYQSPYFQLIIK